MSTRYGNIVSQPGATQVTGMGSAPGPVGGDGWQIVRRLPDASLPAGTGRFAIIVNGKVGNISRSGAAPVNGVVQVCLGLTTGAIAPTYMQQISVNEQLGAIDGLAFQFMMLQSSSPAISDPFFGPTFTAGAGAEWCIWARTFWNGDPQAYAVSFDVSEVSWIWWDTDNIPAADQLVEVYSPAAPVALGLTNAGIWISSNTPGVAGERWLHFQNVTYKPRGHAAGQLAPTIQLGYTTTAASITGFVPKVGSNDRWGQQRAGVPATDAVLAQGGFWTMLQPVGSFQLAVRARDNSAALLQTQIVRAAYVGIKLDNLLDVLVRTEDEVAQATCNLASDPAFPANYIALERPSTGIISEPSVFVHGIVQTDGFQSYDATIWTNRDRVIDWVDSCAVNDFGKGEGVSCMAFGAHGLAPSQPDVQYRVYFVGGLTAPSRALAVRDFCIVQANLVRDPDGVPPVLPGAPTPIVITLGKESPDVGSLLDLPTPPDRSIQELPDREFAGIQGGNYRRRWPIGSRVRAAFTLTWDRLSEAEGLALYAFLRDNTAFRFTPTRGSLIAVVATEAPQVNSEQPIWSMQLRCVQLVWTGS